MLIGVAGILSIAIGLNPASRTRTSMGVVIIAGVALSTFLTLIAIPALAMLKVESLLLTKNLRTRA